MSFFKIVLSGITPSQGLAFGPTASKLGGGSTRPGAAPITLRVGALSSSSGAGAGGSGLNTQIPPATQGPGGIVATLPGYMRPLSSGGGGGSGAGVTFATNFSAQPALGSSRPKSPAQLVGSSSKRI